MFIKYEEYPMSMHVIADLLSETSWFDTEIHDNIEAIQLSMERWEKEYW